MLTAQSVSVRVGRKQLLHDIDLSIQKGELHVLLGPNGAGKTSLLQCLAGVLLPSSGCISVNSKYLSGCSVSERSHLIAVLLQDQALDFPFTVRDVISMGTYPLDRSMLKLATCVNQALATFDLVTLEDQPYTTLSGGEKQRTHLARLSVQISPNTQYILLDEPLKGLDLKHQLQVMAYLKRLADSGVGVFVILHDFSMAASFAQKVSLIKDGELLCTGRVEEVMTSQQLSSLFQTPIEVVDVQGQSVFLTQGSTKP